MKQLHSPILRKLDAFDPYLLHTFFPQIDLLQLSPGSFQGWLFSAQMENCRITAGSFNQSVLCEGRYNPDTFHAGFILSSGHSAVVQAHEYNDGTLTIHRNAIALHEVFPANLAWVDVSIPEKTIPTKLPASTIEKIGECSQIFLMGSRDDLKPIAQWVNEYIGSPTRPPAESELQAIMNRLLSDRLDYHKAKQSFTEGDLFRMHLLNVTHELIRTRNCSQSLAEICKSIGMKPRTVQKYFHEIYGMGPTEYFRMRRLNGARNDLLGGTANVSEVALRWEFSHLGRFAGRYKTHFGESPKETRIQATATPLQ